MSVFKNKKGQRFNVYDPWFWRFSLHKAIWCDAHHTSFFICFIIIVIIIICIILTFVTLLEPTTSLLQLWPPSSVPWIFCWCLSCINCLNHEAPLIFHVICFQLVVDAGGIYLSNMMSPTMDMMSRLIFQVPTGRNQSIDGQKIDAHERIHLFTIG